MNPSPPAPGSQASLREMNRLRVLDAVRDHGSLTQVEIAETTGLSAATVSNVVRELDAAGSVVLSPSIRNGRRAVQVSLAAADGLVAAVVFGDRDVRVAIGTGADDILDEMRMPLPADHAADEGLNRAGRLLGDLLERSGYGLSDVQAAGVGLPAPIDAVSGQVGSEGIMPGWRGVCVADTFQRQLGVPVLLDNTANLAALGELRSGVLQGIHHAVVLQLGHGVGAGLILAGAVFRGGAGTAGEIGHLTLDENGPVCRCGNRGCLDTFVGSTALLRALHGSAGTMTLRDLITRAGAGDPGCRRVLADAGRHLGVAVAGLANLLNPDVVVLSGPMSRVGDLILEPMRAAIERCAIPSAAHSLQLRVSALPERADLAGALVLADEARQRALTDARVG